MTTRTDLENALHSLRDTKGDDGLIEFYGKLGVEGIGEIDPADYDDAIALAKKIGGLTVSANARLSGSKKPDTAAKLNAMADAVYAERKAEAAGKHEGNEP